MGILDIIFSNKPVKTCCGCNNLFYWCDGSAGCEIEKEKECISNGFCLRNPERSCLNCKNYSMRFGWCSELNAYIEFYSDAETCKAFDAY